MLKDLFRRHRALRLGASLAAASVIALGVATPAMAAGSITGPTGGNAPSQNYNIVEGGSATTYTMMEDLSTMFNESPGCDLATASGTQILDYGCPGLNGETGVTLSHQSTTPVTGQVGAAKPNKLKESSIPAGILIHQKVLSDSNGCFAPGTTISNIVINTPPTLDVIVMSTNATCSLPANPETVTFITTPAVGEDGFQPFNQENPFNDVLVQEPPIGSSNGIAQLINQNGHSVGAQNTSPLDAARSSRAPRLDGGPKTPDKAGLNFVAYAQDGVTWMCWTAVAGAATPCANSTLSGSGFNLSTTQLKAIWDDALTCTGPGGSTLTNDWFCLGATTPAPIKLYIAQNGSGTEDTWATTLGLTGSFPFGGEDPNHVIFENQTQSILANGDQANAIFLFSFGKFNHDCGPVSGASSTNSGHSTNATCTGATTSTIQLGAVGGVPVNKTTIGAQLPGSTGSVFPIDRLLYNVYSNGSNAQINASSPATLNALSEDGFLCKPSISKDVDPNSTSGATYLTEIQTEIKAQGFFTIPLTVEDGQGSSIAPFSTTASGIPHPAWTSGLSGSKLRLGG